MQCLLHLKDFLHFMRSLDSELIKKNILLKTILITIGTYFGTEPPSSLLSLARAYVDSVKQGVVPHLTEHEFGDSSGMFGIINKK